MMQQGSMDKESILWSSQITPVNQGKMIVDTEEVVLLLRSLQSSSEHNEVTAALKKIDAFFHLAPKYLEDKSVYTSVLSTMTHMMNDMEIQQLGLEMLHKFMVGSKIIEDKLMRKMEVTNHIIKLLSHNQDQVIYTRSMLLLTKLLVSDHLRKQISDSKHWPKLMSILMAAITQGSRDLSYDSDSMLYSLTVLGTVLKEEPEQQYVLAKKHFYTLVDLFKLPGVKANIVTVLIKILRITATSDEAVALIGLSVINVVRTAITTWKTDRAVLIESFNLLAKLSENEKCSQKLVEKGILMDILLPELLSRSDEPKIQIFGLQIFLSTADFLFQESSVTHSAPHWLKVIYLAMSKNRTKSSIQAFGCKALSKLLECKPEVYIWIGESSDLQQDPIHTLCLGAILMYEKDEDVFASACKSIYYLTADNDGLCRTLMEKNSHIAVIEGLRHHMRSAKAVSAACRAIRGLSIFQNNHKLKMAEYDGDLLQLLAAIIKNFHSDAEVQSEVISTIACLADIDLVRHQCFVIDIHLHVLKAMDDFPGDEYLQEAAIEALAVLGGAASGSEILNAHRAVDKVIKCLKRFVYNGNIQKKGLWAIQILADCQLVQSAVMCKELAAIIKSTMKNYPESLVIQKEAIVAMQILSEQGVQMDRKDNYSNMADVLVEMECHELLFQILEKYDDDQGLHDLASECLYVIGIEQDLKSRMLLTACTKGFIAGAECLIEVGADVNTGNGPETPLYYAVNNNNETMVELLLKHEVRNVQPSLKLSLMRGYDRITGLLLSHIGQDKETGTVLWSNLNLGDLRAAWVMPTLCGREKKAQTASITSKHFVAKIKNSEMRRNHRMHFSLTDSNLESIRHKCFRYRRSSMEVQRQTFEAIYELQAQTQGKQQKQNTVSKKPSSRLLDEMMSPSALRRVHSDSSTPNGKMSQLEISELPVFEHSEDEWEDWKKTTLTGANIPFSPGDPRRPSDLSKITEHVTASFITPADLPGKWLRKFTPKDSPKNHVTQGQENYEHAIHLGLEFRHDHSSDRLSSDTEASISSAASPVLSVHSADDTDLDVSMEEKISRKSPDYRIRNLDMSSNQIAKIDCLVTSGGDLLQSFTSLENLDLGGNLILGLPEDFCKHLTTLKILNLSNNKLTTFPDPVFYCPCLTTLDLSLNKIEVLNLGSHKSQSITDLLIMKNEIKTFPQGLDQAFPHLSRLDISKNKLKDLPNMPCNLVDLQYLDCSHNSILILPEEFFRFSSKLETFIGVNNGLELLPSESLAVHLNRLATVKLSNNRITEKEPFYIPKFILELPNLRSVDLSSNGILGFPPPTLWKTQMLKDLLLSHNQIDKLNLDGSRMWGKLEKLNLSHNKIAELPKEIGHLVALQSLDLSYNKFLSSLPDELGRCSKIWEMPMDGLSLDLDDGLTRGRVKDLILYLHNRLKKAQRYYRMKLMVVGYGGRGKSSLLQALKKKVKSNSAEKPSVTVGVIVEDWKYERQRFGKSVTYTLNTWDFAGQEDFYSTHQCFLSNRTLYLVVYDISMGTEEIDKLKPWLSNIHARAPGCPVIVVGTHYDLLPVEDRESTVVEFESKLQKLMNKPGFPAITCFAIVDLTKESHELQLLRNKVKDTVDEFKVKGQPVMGQKVPASYVKLGELLHEEAKNVQKCFPVIRHGQLIRLIKNANIDLEDEELKQAINFLHESGVLLHYNETALQMKDFYFINPGWLCRMMAQIVTVPEINPFIDRNGVMKRSSAGLLFTGKETSGSSHFVFPTSLIPQYLHLLEKFEIALPRNEEELLIPCRLPNRRPNFELPIQNKEELVFRYYVMPHTPIGFWSRLLTRLIVFTESKFVENMLYLHEKPQVHFWQEGIFVLWNDAAFFLVDSFKGLSDEIHMTVPSTPHGCRLLGYLVDHADSLIDEWYPGLVSIDPMLGRELLEKYVPCTACSGLQSHVFRFEDLLKHSENHTDIFCPIHNGTVDLVKLAPDVMLADVEPQFHLDLEQFEFKESLENLCGDGGFGSVYKAKYQGKVVAVKVFSAIGDIHPHKMLRQEATILRRLKHPSVISLLAVAVHPVRLVVMEFAPNKTLGEVFRSGPRLSRTLQLKISQQISEGLAYLHSLMIIYRDMKPDNVLIFTLAPDALINAKIADYGISQFTTLFGLVAQEGTPGYRAPEVVRGEIYSFQADIFSLGVLMYMVLTGGQHPFEELEFKSEIDKAFAENLPIAPITQKSCAPWPDFQELITQCLSQVPDYRPKAAEVFESLNSAELFSLREVLPVSVGTTVECIATQLLSSKNVRLWIASGDNDYMQLTWLNLLDYRDEVLNAERSRQSVDYSGMGTMFRDGRVLCLLPVNQDHILLGTQARKIWVFNTVTNELVHSTQQLDDSVLCLYLVQRKFPQATYRRTDDPLVLAGLANGKMALYPLSELLQEPDMDPIEMKLGESYEPVKCILYSSTEHKLIASCGTKFVVMEIKIGVAVVNIYNTVEVSNFLSKPISSMASGRQLYLAHRNSSVVEAWDVSKGKRKNSLDVSISFNLTSKEGRITAMVLNELKTLWVGTGGGQIILIDVNNWIPVISFHRHTASIRCLHAVKIKNSSKYGANSSTTVILSGGLGFKTRSESTMDKDSHYGCIGVWDANFPQIAKQFSDCAKKRKELSETRRTQSLSSGL
ncbi:leucine-rich repeat serine/threonine-protein kinase 2-like [Physella acuta]|uniref:leucine-rich repeat serine/threonine-protein kinase 2-like n=1 Tax=Physella acuta TaxID=109671 RepID=UPI0027DCDF82|nr:leucine-rich repeat serine/threonine-protein kinase 2-like [Physella acuta]